MAIAKTKKAAPKKKTAAKHQTTRTKDNASSRSNSSSRRWSANVTQHSNALDLDKGVFKKHNAVQIAHSLENSAEKSRRKKSDSYHSAMSMLTFYINRAGQNLPESQKKILNKAKDILRQDHEKTQGQKTQSQKTQSQTRKRTSPKTSR